MKTLIPYAVVLALMILLIPWFASPPAQDDGTFCRSSAGDKVALDSLTPSPATPPPSAAALWRARAFRVSKDGELVSVSVYDYLCGVLAGEMMMTSPKEALKAVAVAAFSYALHRRDLLDANPDALSAHPGAVVCSSHLHCLEYVTKEEARLKWGAEWVDGHWHLIEEAVTEALGRVIEYDGTPIDAVFHDTSSGVTESAEVMWGAPVPYLSSVDSHWDALAPGYQSSAAFTDGELWDIISKAFPDATDAAPGGRAAVTARSDAGTVIAATVCGATLTGLQVRETLNLRSAVFDVSYADGVTTFAVRGYGHGVGLSQSGAVAQALEGRGCDEILGWYYPGTIVTEYAWR